MKFLLSWLEEHADLGGDVGRVAMDLPRLGFEAVDVKTLGAAFTGVVAAKVVSVQKHANADRLSVCSVEDGGSLLSVVCGAPNVQAGQTVALARVGAVLPGGRSIARARIRGVESQGMICSAPELGLPEDPKDGILVLEPGIKPGTDLSGRIGSPPDAVLDVDVTPNRPDCLSHRGLARELAALRGVPIKPFAAVAAIPEAPSALPVSLEAPEACPAYLGLLIEGVSARPSPAWLARRLEAVGAKATNILVDASNYVLLDLGQPLHAFDANRIAGGKISVRWGRAGETMKALDGKEYALTPSCLVIADAAGPAALAGIMGGLGSSVSERTDRVFLESAYFLPQPIRKASRLLRLGSESSYRFERGIDPGGLRQAAARAARLIIDACGGSCKISGTTFAGEPPRAPSSIRFTAPGLSAVLGAEMSPARIESLLEPVSAAFIREGDAFSFTPPTWRRDLAEVCDLAEEAARMEGYDRIPSRLPRFPLHPASVPATQTLRRDLRARLSALGFFEAYHYDFLSRAWLEKAGYPARPDDPRLVNPVSDEWEYLRPTLLIGLMEAARRNANRGAQSLRLFEIGEAYAAGPHGAPRGREKIAGIAMGAKPARYWDRSRVRPLDFFDWKGIVSDLLPGIAEERWADSAPEDCGEKIFFHDGASRYLVAGAGSPAAVLGAFGIAKPSVARAFGLDPVPVLLFEFDSEPFLEAARARGLARYKAPSLFQSAWRDISILLPDSARFSFVAEAIGASGAGELAAWELVDEFAGEGIPEGRRSLTLRLTFSAADRTLTDAEVSSAVEKILGRLGRDCGATLRE